MDRRFRTKQDALSRRLFIEPLESRSLLSGLPLVEMVADVSSPASEVVGPLVDEAAPIVVDFAPQADEILPDLSQTAPPVENSLPHFDEVAPIPAIESTVTVEVIEIGVPDNTNAVVLPIAESELPQLVVDAVDSLFPGADLVVAELHDDNGTAVYEVTTEFQGRPIDVTFNNDGDVLDTAYEVLPTELPQPVQDWVEENFPGSMIGTAELVTQSDGISYDLLITTEAGEFVAATLRLQNVKTPREFRAALEKFADVPSAPAAADSEVPVDETLPAEQTTSDVPLDPKSSETDTADDPAHSSASFAPEDGQSEGTEAEDVVAASHTDPIAAGESSTEIVDEQLETITSDGLTECLPQLAGVINDLLPIDMAAVEQGLLHLLDEVDGVLDSVANSAAANSWVTRGAIVAVLVAGARVIVLESKKRKLEPILISGVANSTWGWLLSATTPTPLD